MKEIEQAINALHHVAYAMQQGKINDTALMRDGRLCTVGELVNEAFVALRAMQERQADIYDLYKGGKRTVADLQDGRGGLTESAYDEGWNDCIDYLASAPKPEGTK